MIRVAQSMLHRRRDSFFIAALVIGYASPLYAHAVTGAQRSGQVTDPAGAAVPDATVADDLDGDARQPRRSYRFSRLLQSPQSVRWVLRPRRTAHESKEYEHKGIVPGTQLTPRVLQNQFAQGISPLIRDNLNRCPIVNCSAN